MARGWVKYEASTSTRYPFTIYKHGQNFVKNFSILNIASNKEYAFLHRVKDVNGNYGSEEWLPDHSGRGTVFLGKQTIKIDDVTVTDWTPQTVFKDAENVTVVQDMLGYHPNDLANPTTKIITTHFFTNKGVHIVGKLQALKDIKIDKGYVFMFPVDPSDFAENLITGFNNKYPTGLYATQGQTVLSEKFDSKSYAFVNTSTAGMKDVVAALTVHNIQDTFRYDQSGREENLGVWIEHRTAGLDKLYPQVFFEKEMATGETFTFFGTYHIGEIPLVNEFY